MDAPLWPDKYRARSLHDVVGNRACVEKLVTWLGQWAQGGAGRKKAALLSGPPGVGKSMSAALAVQYCGYEYKEFNASDTRSKKMIAASVAEYTRSASVAFGPHRKRVLIMDEVDGMGTGDRGGMAELIGVIKETCIPVICICNDRASPKVKSLASHCTDLRFQRPSVHEVLQRITPIAHAEGFAGEPGALEKLVVSCNGDVRHVLNTLHFFAGRPGASTRQGVEVTQPDDALVRLFGDAAASLDAKLDMYFVDSGKVPLHVQDAYARVVPQGDAADMDALARVAAAVSDGDLVDTEMRATQNYELMPLHGVLSCVRPASFLNTELFLNRRSRFPTWLGKNSTTTKNRRLLSETAASMRAALGGVSSDEVRLCYFPGVLRDRLYAPLDEFHKDGIDAVIATMDAYGLDCTGRQSLFDVSFLGFSLIKPPPHSQIPAVVKSALTRTFNQRHLLVRETTKKKRRAAPRARTSQGKRAKVGKNA